MKRPNSFQTGRIFTMLPSIFLGLALFVPVSTRVALAQTAPPRTELWRSLVAGRDLRVQYLEPLQREVRAVPLVIYLQNLAAPRVGRERDEVILRDLRASGNLVALLDYKHLPQSRGPLLNRDLAKLRDDVRAHSLASGFKIDETRVFIVPSGSRLKCNVPFFRHGERVWAMDIIYPSQSEQPVGSVLEFSCDNANRMGNTSLSICSDTLLDGAATEGFAVAMADHPVPAPYQGLDPMPDVAFKVKAAVRTLRAQSASLGLNGKIVPVGFSRGSGMALMLVTTQDRREFDGKGEHLEQSSAVQGVVVLSGRFTYLDLLADDKMLARYAKAWGERETNLETWRRQGALDFLEERAAVPLFLSINVSEGTDALHQMSVLRQRLAQTNSDEAFRLETEPRGHKVPLAPAILEEITAYLKRQLSN